MFPAVIFDFNGVLVDDESVHLAAFRDVVAPYGITITDEAYLERYFGFDDAGAFRALFEDHGIPRTSAQIAELIDEKRPRYRARAETSLVIFEGAPRVLAQCAQAGPVAICSGALREEIEFALIKMDARASVSIIVSAEDTERCKPDPEGYVRAVAELARTLPPHAARQALVVEDSLAGVHAAKAANLYCLAVAHSYPAARLTEAGADHVVARIGDITPSLLAQLAPQTQGT